jgi:TonB family protein
MSRTLNILFASVLLLAGCQSFFGEDDRKPVQIGEVAQAIYPYELLREGIAGRVVFRFVVWKDGSVGNIEIISSPHEQFSRSVISAVSKWRFLPGVSNGIVQDTIMKNHIDFSPP